MRKERLTTWPRVLYAAFIGAAYAALWPYPMIEFLWRR